MWLLVGCDFACIHVPIRLSTGRLNNETLEHVLKENENLQFALDSYTGKLTIHKSGHKLFNSEFHLVQKKLKVIRPLRL